MGSLERLEGRQRCSVGSSRWARRRRTRDRRSSSWVTPGYKVDVEVQARSLWSRLKSYGSTAMADDRDDLRIRVVGGTVPDTSEAGELRLGDGQVLSASYHRHKFLAE